MMSLEKPVRAIKAVSIGEAMIEMAPVGAEFYSKGFAGDTYNTIWHMAQLLGSRATTSFVTRIGRDKLSNAFAEQLVADGLNDVGVARDEFRTMGLYLIELQGAERSFHYWRENSAARSMADDRLILDVALQDANLVHVSGITLAILKSESRRNLFQALKACRRKGALISFDPNFRPRLWPDLDEARAAMLEMYEITDIVLPSFDDERALWADETPDLSIHRLKRHGLKTIVLKNGAKPVSYFTANDIGTVETPTATDVVDTTGAGDAFNAGYLAGRLLGLPTVEAIAKGQQLAGIVLKNPGARAPLQLVRSLANLSLATNY